VSIKIAIFFSMIFSGALRSGAEEAVRETLGALARPLMTPEDLSPLIDRAAGTQLVLLGEATHGTSEFYTWRAEISKRLIEEKGFCFIAVEGDWAACYRLNRFVKDLPGAEPDAREIMRSFTRWPQWMWANEETLALVEWLRAFNRSRPPEERAGFYGMDVYGDEQALAGLLEKLQGLDASLAEDARALYGPFLPYAGDPGKYVRRLRAGGGSFEEGAASGRALLKARTRNLLEENPEARLHILQSALVIQNAEAHYRAMQQPGSSSWNARAGHFYESVERLMDHYGPGAQGLVWAHNTHIGDARATPMASSGDSNIGQTARMALGEKQVTAVGFGTWRGTVIAGRQWGAPPERMTLPPGGPGSYEELMNSLELDAALFIFDSGTDLSALDPPRGHRAVGVVYHPEREYPGNYVPTRLARRYDAFIFIRETAALKPVQ
jgi:erythromycin esterase